MGSRQLGELLLRPSSLRGLTTPHTSTYLSRRSLSSTRVQSAAQPQPRIRFTTGPADENTQHNTSRRDHTIQAHEAQTQSQPESASPSQAQESPVLFSNRKRTANPTTTQALDDMFANFNRGTSSAPQQQQQQQPQTQQPGRTSADSFNAAYASRRTAFGANFSRPGPGPLKPRGLDFGAMAMPSGTPSTSPNSGPPAPQQQPLEEQKFPRLNASTGRSITLNPARGRDIVRGLSMLGTLVARNRVRQDVFRQKFHERPGLKRKRLHSERWRARFKVEFDRTVRRVNDLRKKGW